MHMDNLPGYIMTVFLSDSLISIHSFTHSFVKVLLYSSRMLWASSPSSHGRKERGEWPGSCGEACSWLSHLFPFPLSTRSLSLSVTGQGGGDAGEESINGLKGEED